MSRLVHVFYDTSSQSELTHPLEGDTLRSPSVKVSLLKCQRGLVLAPSLSAESVRACWAASRHKELTGAQAGITQEVHGDKKPGHSRHVYVRRFEHAARPHGADLAS